MDCNLLYQTFYKYFVTVLFDFDGGQFYQNGTKSEGEMKLLAS